MMYRFDLVVLLDGSEEFAEVGQDRLSYPQRLIRAHRFAATGLVSALQLPDLYRRPRLSSYEWTL